LNEKAYAIAKKHWTEERTRDYIEARIRKKKGGIPYMRANKRVTVGGMLYFYDKDRKISKRLQDATFRQVHEKVKTKGKIKQADKKQASVAMTDELRNVYARKIQKFYVTKSKLILTPSSLVRS